MASLAEIPESQAFPKNSAIEDFGNFSEGYCFKLNVAIPLHEVFVICCENSVR